MSIKKRSKAHVDRPDEGDLRMTILGLEGIFWALNMLVVEGVADEVAGDEDRRNGIGSLIVAGELLAKEATDRF